MTIKGVLFDASGTLLRIESAQRWLAAVLASRGIDARDEDVHAYGDRLGAVGAVPGGNPPQVVPAHLAEVWKRRDETEELHRAAFTGLAREVQLPWPGLYDALYERTFTPDAWQLYPDTQETLMVGDERRKDGGAEDAGCSYLPVDHLPVDRRPEGLKPVLEMVSGIGG